MSSNHIEIPKEAWLFWKQEEINSAVKQLESVSYMMYMNKKRLRKGYITQKQYCKIISIYKDKAWKHRERLRVLEREMDTLKRMLGEE